MSGTLVKLGTGSLTLTGSVTQGTVTLTGGTLSITGTTAATTITTAAGTTLKGTGTLGQSVTGMTNVSGTVAPGASIGTLTILGDFTQTSGSTLEVELSPTASDLLAVEGMYTIESNVTLSLLPEFGTYAPLTSYTIVTATNGRSGTFDISTISLPSLQFEVFYFPNEILLLLNILPFSNLSLTGNALIAGQCLDTASPAQGSDLDTVIDQLRFMNAQEQQRTLDQMQPSIFNTLDLAIQETLFSISSNLSKTLLDRATSSCGDKPLANSWLNYSYTHANQANEYHQIGYRDRAQTGSLGFDWFYPTGHLFGVNLGFANDHLDWKNAYGTANVDSYLAGAETLLRFHNTYLSFNAQGAYLRSRAKRSILFKGVLYDEETRHAYHKNQGWSLLGGLEFGWSVVKGHAELDCFISSGYLYGVQGAFNENGAGSINLRMQSHSSDLLRSTAGVRFLKEMHSDENMTCNYERFGSIDATIAVVREDRFLGKHQTGQFEAVNCNMVVQGLHPNRWLGNATLSASIGRGRFMFSLSGEGLWGENYSSYQGSGKIAWSF